MEAIYVNRFDLKLGDLIAEDLFVNTQYPIIFKDTKITYEHLQVLEAFNIIKVLIFKTLDEISEHYTLEGNEKDIITMPVPVFTPFEQQYSNAIKYLTKEFANWQAGARIEMIKFREIMLPLIEAVLEKKSYIYDLHTYSNGQDYVYHHSVATGLIAGILAQKLGFERGITIQIALAGILADCGMARVPNKIREKKTSLTEGEFLEIHRHPLYSYQLVKDLPALKNDMKLAIVQHHERVDGSGYPQGVKGENISIYSQILAVADVFNAMTSERLYREKQSPFKVIEMIKEEEFGKFDIKVVQALIGIVADLPIGTKIELSNLEHAEVMFINQFVPTRPVVKLLSTGEIIDLSKIRHFYISRIIVD